ncbi:MAG: N-acetylmuramoyl-L-alanine amidase [Gemmatimonadetes bacterium]|nr:N-acetylmuramoyl-L-alanine amidase [Gemmatimonadota bacterium]
MKLTVLSAAVVLFAGCAGPVASGVAAQEQRAAERDAAASERWGRWRDYNRYPGPIPTPEEWEPPPGPIRIGLQAGHWLAAEAPQELRRIRYNGTRWKETAEWEANLVIARLAAAELETLGYEVDILPAVVPPGYRAHLFISIHADGSDSPAASGYRVSAPRRDATGRAEDAARVLRETYGAATGLRNLPVSTRRMRNYYAFNYRRYEHALHPMTIALIIETGFMTSARDRTIILGAPERAARGIVEGIKAFSVTAPPAPPTTGREDGRRDDG